MRDEQHTADLLRPKRRYLRASERTPFPFGRHVPTQCAARESAFTRTGKALLRSMKLRKRVWAACFCIAAVCSLLFFKRTSAQSDLQITYGSQGIQTLTYRGQLLEDVGQYPGDGHLSAGIWTSLIANRSCTSPVLVS